MKSKMVLQISRGALISIAVWRSVLKMLGVGLVLSVAWAARANTLVTFQVDMSQAVAAGSFDPSTQTVGAHGSFNGWSKLALTNNPSDPVNPNLWTGTTDIATNGTTIEYKYVIEPGTWESIPKGNNRLAVLPSDSGASLILPKVYYADIPPATISVTVKFQVDLAQQINLGAFDPASSLVWPKGTFNGWSTWESMTNDPTILRTNQYGLVSSNVYVGIYTVMASPGQTMDYKYYIDTGSRYESPTPGTGDPSDNNNRFFNLAQVDGDTQEVPLVFFSDAPYAPVATNTVTFQVDMTAQVLNGNFDPATGSVQVRGSFNNWGSSDICTNDPAATNTNLYKAVVAIVDGLGNTEEYKFWASVSANSGWETIANNRSFKMTSTAEQVMPVVFFSNINPTDLLSADTLVTFRVNMDGAQALAWNGNPAFAFNPSANGVWFNGDCLTNGWYSPWGTMWPETQLNDSGTNGDMVAKDNVYTFQYLVTKGKTLRVQYKYGIDSGDNEAPSGQDRVRYIRGVGSYVMPIDTFGNQYQESAFGNLAISPPVAGRAMVTWLGLPGVHLQTAASLNSSWTDLLETDGLSSTNYPVNGQQTFFRLIKPGN